jgi:hypothetical protein
LLLAQLQTIWTTEPRLLPDNPGWSIWIAQALDRIKLFCQEERARRVQAKRARTKQVKETLASAERLLQKNPTDSLL